MLDKSRHFRKTKGGYGNGKPNEYNLPKATPEELQHIRNVTKRQQQKRAMFVGILLLIFIPLGVYIMFRLVL